jgi:hypothetical protein
VIKEKEQFELACKKAINIEFFKELGIEEVEFNKSQ